MIQQEARFLKIGQHDRSNMTEKRAMIGNGCSTSHSRRIMYQSRMRYLKSRDGSSYDKSSRTKLAERGERSQLPSFSSLLGASRTPCMADKLLPPMELMTRERSLRRVYWENHTPVTHVKRMNFLEKKENPVLKRKRDAIFARIRAAELASERLKREKKSWQRSEQQRIGGTGGVGAGEGSAATSNTSPESSCHEDHQDGESLNRRKQSEVQYSEDTIGDVSGFIFDKKKDPSSSSAGIDDTNEDENFGDSFAFLADWNKKTKISSYKRRNRNKKLQQI